MESPLPSPSLSPTGAVRRAESPTAERFDYLAILRQRVEAPAGDAGQSWGGSATATTSPHSASSGATARCGGGGRGRRPQQSSRLLQPLSKAPKAIAQQNPPGNASLRGARRGRERGERGDPHKASLIAPSPRVLSAESKPPKSLGTLQPAARGRNDSPGAPQPCAPQSLRGAGRDCGGKHVYTSSDQNSTSPKVSFTVAGATLPQKVPACRE